MAGRPVCVYMLEKKPEIVVAVDGCGGDRGSKHIVNAVNFALTLYPYMRLIICGPVSLQEELNHGRIDGKRVEFRLSGQAIPQDAPVNEVLERYQKSSMRLALQAVQSGEAQAMVSAGGTGPLVVLARHLLGEIGHLRPALVARIPAGPGRHALMLDLGANAQSTAQDLTDFARLGDAAARLMLGLESPRLALLNVGTEEQKGSHVVLEAKSLLDNARELNFCGFIEADRIFRGDADVVVADGFAGNIALKAAEGVYTIFSKVPGIKRVFARLAHPDWLMPWQYNGSVLLGVNGNVIKSHANAGDDAFAVAMVEAAKAAELDLANGMRDILTHAGA